MLVGSAAPVVQKNAAVLVFRVVEFVGDALSYGHLRKRSHRRLVSRARLVPLTVRVQLLLYERVVVVFTPIASAIIVVVFGRLLGLESDRAAVRLVVVLHERGLLLLLLLRLAQLDRDIDQLIVYLQLLLIVLVMLPQILNALLAVGILL